MWGKFILIFTNNSLCVISIFLEVNFGKATVKCTADFQLYVEFANSSVTIVCGVSTDLRQDVLYVLR